MKAYTVESLAERWDCHAETVRAMIRRGLIHAFKVGKQLRISAEEVARYENQ